MTEFINFVLKVIGVWFLLSILAAIIYIMIFGQRKDVTPDIDDSIFESAERFNDSHSHE